MPRSDSDHDDDDGNLSVFFEEVKTLVKEFESAVTEFGKAEKATKQKKSTLADKKQKAAQEAIKIFSGEMKAADDSERRQYEKDFKRQEEKYKELVSRLKQFREDKPSADEPKPEKKKKGTRDDLLGAADEKPKKEKSKKPLGAQDLEDDDEVEVVEVQSTSGGKKRGKKGGGQKQKQEQPNEVQEILDIQKESEDILNRMLVTGEETIEIGTQAAAKLKEQTEKMVQIQKELDELGSGLKRARKELNAFMRGLACDHCMGKVIIAFVILLALGVVAIIVLRSVKPDIFSPATVAPSPAASGQPATTTTITPIII